jgi:hypothetical protein
MAALAFVVLSRCGRLWGADRSLGMAETGSLGLVFMKEGIGGVAA